MDPTALSKALKDMEDAGRVRERTPGASPSRKRQRVYGDRSVKVAVVVLSKDFWGSKYILVASLANSRLA